MHNTAIIILAAGNSSRLGKPKQLLPYKNKPLLLHTVDAAIAAVLNPIIVVTGYDHEIISNVLINYPTRIAYNPGWQEGMATGIVAGIKKAEEEGSSVENLILAVCDQPYVDSVLFTKMIDAQRSSGKSIVACSYANTIGVPVLFSSKYFDDLLKLKGKEGAKKLLKQFENDVFFLDFPEGAIDIDTMEDYNVII